MPRVRCWSIETKLLATGGEAAADTERAARRAYPPRPLWLVAARPRGLRGAAVQATQRSRVNLVMTSLSRSEASNLSLATNRPLMVQNPGQSLVEVKLGSGPPCLDRNSLDPIPAQDPSIQIAQHTHTQQHDLLLRRLHVSGMSVLADFFTCFLKSAPYK